MAQLKQLLTDANNHAMALIGPRRCGKSSLLNMLPVLLPDSIIVQFDLQDNPADTPIRFYQGLSKVAQSQARRSHDLALPGLDDTTASPIEALSLVNVLNDEKRKQATLLDLEQVEPEILQECTYYFRSIWQEVPPAGQAVLEALAHGQPAHMDTPTRLWLRRRMVMTEDELLAIPLFGRWIREKDLV